jgi:catalase
MDVRPLLEYCAFWLPERRDRESGMSQPPIAPKGNALGSLALIAGIAAAGAVAFGFTAGWFSPHRLTPQKIVQALAPAGGPSLGHRRNHAKGICFTGTFEANGAGSEFSRATVLARGSYPALGRFNLATADANAPDATVRVRGLGLRIAPPDGQEWRAALIDAPFFPVATPQAFYALLQASASKQPDAMKNFIGAHPEFLAFVGWAKSAPWLDSYAAEKFNSLDSFMFVDSGGNGHAVRWSLVPAAPPVAVSPDDLAKRGADYLEQEIASRVHGGKQHWDMVITVANIGDPTADPSKAWPADRRTVTVGTLVVDQVQAEADGPCRDINFDPAVLPAGITTSDDPFPAARSSAYRVSYDLRTAEEKDYPRTASGAKP